MKLAKARVTQVLAGALLLVALAVAVVVMRARVPRTVVMATGPAGSMYELYGEQYRQLLARSGVQVQLRPSGGSIENLGLLSDAGAGIDAGFVSAGSTGTDKSPQLRTLGTVFLEQLWFFSRDPAVAQGDLTALRGKRMSIGTTGSATRAVAQVMLRLNQIDPGYADFVALAPQEAAEQLRRGDIQAAFIVTSADSPVVRRLLADPAINLVGFPRAAAYVALYPFLMQFTVPEGVGDLASNRPPRDIQTIGAPVSLVVHANMHPALQALLLRAASQIHSKPGMFNAAGRFPAAEALDIPLSDGAIQYYKSGTPFLQRYLPFSLAVLAGQLLFIVVPLFGILYPLLRLGPGLYSWGMRTRVFRLYGKLKLLEKELDQNPDEARKLDLRKDLEALSRRVERMRTPNTYAPLIYTLRLHINLVRDRL
jgi:TRAP transporter TAXI family solute receptor